MGTLNSTGFSAVVRLWLVVGDQMIPLSHASSTFVIAKAPTNLPVGDAEIVFTVDNERYERKVRLVNGMNGAVRQTMILGRDHLPF